MTFDRTNNDGNEPNSEGNAAPDMVVRQSLAAFKTDPPRGLSIKAAYEMGRLGLEMLCHKILRRQLCNEVAKMRPCPQVSTPTAYGVLIKNN